MTEKVNENLLKLVSHFARKSSPPEQSSVQVDPSPGAEETNTTGNTTKSTSMGAPAPVEGTKGTNAKYKLYTSLKLENFLKKEAYSGTVLVQHSCESIVILQ